MRRNCAVVREGLAEGRIVNAEISDHNAAALEREGYAALAAFFERGCSSEGGDVS